MNAPIETRTMVPLLYMNSDEIKQFEEKVVFAAGNIPALVDPFRLDRLGRPHINTDGLNTYISVRNTRIHNILGSSPPLLIFEESAFIDELSNRIARKSRKPLYFVDIGKGEIDQFDTSLTNVINIFLAANVHAINLGGVNQNELVDRAAAKLVEKHFTVVHNLPVYDEDITESEI